VLAAIKRSDLKEIACHHCKEKARFFRQYGMIISQLKYAFRLLLS